MKPTSTNTPDHFPRPRKRPNQPRSSSTMDAILEAAASLLEAGYLTMAVR
jgi:hypothetical protein